MSRGAPAAGLHAAAATLADWVRHERDFGRLALWLPVWAVLGIFAAVEIPDAPPLAPLLALTAGAIALRMVSVRRGGAAPIAIPSAIAAALLLGASAVGLQERVFGTAVIPFPTSVAFVGEIVAAERLSPKRQRIVVVPTEADLPAPWPARIRLTVRGGPLLPVGATVRARARLFPLRGPVMPGGYDAGRRLYFDRIGASGFTYGPPEIVAPPGATPRALVDAVRRSIAERIAAAMPERTGAFATALLVGRRGLMDEADVEALRVSGLGHILAISGLHMALVAGSVFAAIRFALAWVPRLALAYPIRKWAAVVGLVAATFYLAVSGGSVATQRAYIMLAVALCAVLLDRPALTMRTVAVAALVCLALDPISALEPSFQMSFLAVVALVGAYEWWSHWRATHPRRADRRPGAITAFMVGLLATSLIAGLATAPPSAFHFHRLAPFGLIANGLAMPVFSLVAMPAGVVALVAMPLGLEGLPLAVMERALRAVLWIADETAALSGDRGLIGAITGLSAATMAFGIVWLAVMTAPWRLAGVAIIAAGLVLAQERDRPQVLISDDGVLIAAQGPDGQLNLIGRANSFAAQIWQKAAGRTGDAASRSPPQCDGLGCTLPLAAGRLATPTSLTGFADDCALARVIVSRHALPPCPGAVVIDRNTLRRSGSLALYREPDGWRVVAAWPNGPRRAWQVPPTVRRP